IYVPTAPLGRLVPAKRQELLPPGGQILAPAPAALAEQILYVGANGPYDGVHELMAAMQQVHAQRPKSRLVLVLRRAEWPKPPWPEYIHITAASFDELAPWYHSSAVAVIPRKDTAYNRLAWPVKLMDYWSYGLPVVVTGPSPAADAVALYHGGIVVRSGVPALAQGLVQLLANPEIRQAARDNGLRAIRQEHSWQHRAQQILEQLHLS
ncbi:MAG: glycosyltransferase, partial [Firmicutes bacterium]|nr:glycosyltransferase [Bacillota bacterium]